METPRRSRTGQGQDTDLQDDVARVGAVLPPLKLEEAHCAVEVACLHAVPHPVAVFARHGFLLCEASAGQAISRLALAVQKGSLGMSTGMEGQFGAAGIPVARAHTFPTGAEKQHWDR